MHIHEETLYDPPSPILGGLYNPLTYEEREALTLALQERARLGLSEEVCLYVDPLSGSSAFALPLGEERFLLFELDSPPY